MDQWITIWAISLSSDRVADGLEIFKGVEFRENMVLNEQDFLLVGELVEGAGREIVESVISGSKHSHAIIGAVELDVDLVADLGSVEELDEDAVIPAGLFQNRRDVDWPRRSWRRSLSLSQTQQQKR